MANIGSDFLSNFLQFGDWAISEAAPAIAQTALQLRQREASQMVTKAMLDADRAMQERIREFEYQDDYADFDSQWDQFADRYSEQVLSQFGDNALAIRAFNEQFRARHQAARPGVVGLADRRSKELTRAILPGQLDAFMSNGNYDGAMELISRSELALAEQVPLMDYVTQNFAYTRARSAAILEYGRGGPQELARSIGVLSDPELSSGLSPEQIGSIRTELEQMEEHRQEMAVQASEAELGGIYRELHSFINGIGPEEPPPLTSDQVAAMYQDRVNQHLSVTGGDGGRFNQILRLLDGKHAAWMRAQEADSGQARADAETQLGANLMNAHAELIRNLSRPGLTYTEGLDLIFQFEDEHQPLQPGSPFASNWDSTLRSHLGRLSDAGLNQALTTFESLNTAGNRPALEGLQYTDAINRITREVGLLMQEEGAQVTTEILNRFAVNAFLDATDNLTVPDVDPAADASVADLMTRAGGREINREESGRPDWGARRRASGMGPLGELLFQIDTGQTIGYRGLERGQATDYARETTQLSQVLRDQFREQHNVPTGQFISTTSRVSGRPIFLVRASSDDPHAVLYQGQHYRQYTYRITSSDSSQWLDGPGLFLVNPNSPVSPLTGEREMLPVDGAPDFSPTASIIRLQNQGRGE